QQFESVVLLAGSTGATFTVPLLRDIVQRWRAPPSQNPGIFSTPKGAVTRYVRFVWVVKSRGQLSWFAAQLSGIFEDVQNLQSQERQVEIDMSIYVTCDSSFTEEHKSLLSSVT